MNRLLGAEGDDGEIIVGKEPKILQDWFTTWEGNQDLMTSCRLILTEIILTMAPLPSPQNFYLKKDLEVKIGSYV